MWGHIIYLNQVKYVFLSKTMKACLATASFLLNFPPLVSLMTL